MADSPLPAPRDVGSVDEAAATPLPEQPTAVAPAPVPAAESPATRNPFDVHDTPATPQAANAFDQFDGEPNQKPGLIEQFRLASQESYYRGTIQGSFEMYRKGLSSERIDNDPNLTPEQKESWKRYFAKQGDLDVVVAANKAKVREDLANWEAMPEWHGPMEAAARLAGTVYGAGWSFETYLGAPLLKAGKLATPFLRGTVGRVAGKVGGEGAAKAATAVGAEAVASGVTQAGVQLATDPVVQAFSVAGQVQAEYEPLRTAMAPALGFGFGAGMHVFGEAAGAGLRKVMPGVPDVFPSGAVAAKELPPIARDDAGALTGKGTPAPQAEAAAPAPQQPKPAYGEWDGSDIETMPLQPSEAAAGAKRALDAADANPEALPDARGAAIPPTPNEPAGVFQFSAGDLKTDPERFQFKSDTDAAGVNDKLRNVDRWEPSKGSQLIVWEDAHGQRFVADGHQRTALATRLNERDGGDIKVPGLLLRESDGFTAADAMVMAAEKNIAEGSGGLMDAARIMRTQPEAARNLDRLSDTRIRQAGDLSRLGDDAWRMTLNEHVEPEMASVVGKVVRDPAQQVRAIEAIRDLGPKNQAEAEILARRVAAEPTLVHGQGLMDEVRVQAMAGKELLQDRGLMRTVLKGADVIEEAGAGTVDRTAAQLRAEESDALNKGLAAAAARPGPIREALTKYAKEVQDGTRSHADAARAFVSDVRRAVSADADGWAGPRPAGPDGAAGPAAEPGRGPGGGDAGAGADPAERGGDAGAAGAAAPEARPVTPRTVEDTRAARDAYDAHQALVTKKLRKGEDPQAKQAEAAATEAALRRQLDVPEAGAQGLDDLQAARLARFEELDSLLRWGIPAAREAGDTNQVRRLRRQAGKMFDELDLNRPAVGETVPVATAPAPEKRAPRGDGMVTLEDAGEPNARNPKPAAAEDVVPEGATVIEQTPEVAKHPGLIEAEEALAALQKEKRRLTGLDKSHERTTGLAKNTREISKAEKRVQQEVENRKAFDQQAIDLAAEAPSPERHVDVQGIQVTVEAEKGGVRVGRNPDGTEWRGRSRATYGRIEGATSADGMPLDAYLGDNPASDKVFVWNQMTADGKSFDEHKVFVGFDSFGDARRTYMDTWPTHKTALNRVGTFKQMTVAEFKDWVANGDLQRAITKSGGAKIDGPVTVKVHPDIAAKIKARDPEGTTLGAMSTDAFGRPLQEMTIADLKGASKRLEAQRVAAFEASGKGQAEAAAAARPDIVKPEMPAPEQAEAAWLMDMVPPPPVDTARPMTRVYHGTNSGNIQEWDRARFNPEALYGPGIYLTENPAIASSYAANKASHGFNDIVTDIPTLQRYFEPGQVIDGSKVISFDPGADGRWSVTMEGRDGMRDRVHSSSPYRRDVDASLRERGLIDEAGPNVMPLDIRLEKPFDFEQAVSPADVDSILSHLDQASILDAEDAAAIRATLAGTEGKGSDVWAAISGRMKEVNDYVSKPEITAAMEAAGFDGIKHIGGLSSQWGGGEPHQVWIAFDPKTVQFAYARSAVVRELADPETAAVAREVYGESLPLEWRDAPAVQTLADSVPPPADEGRPWTRVYHGTGNGRIERIDFNRQSDDSLYGPGFYMTESPTIASEYADINRFAAPHAELFWQNPEYAQFFTPGRKYVDDAGEMHTVLEFHDNQTGDVMNDIYKPDVAAVTMRNDATGEVVTRNKPTLRYEDLRAAGLDEDPELNRVAWPNVVPLDVHFHRAFDIDTAVPAKDLAEIRAAALARGVDAGTVGNLKDGMTGRQVYEGLTSSLNNVAANEVPLSKKVMTDLLRDLGYDGIKHTGGLSARGRGTPHQVWIALNEDAVRFAYARSAVVESLGDPETAAAAREVYGDSLPKEWDEAAAMASLAQERKARVAESQAEPPFRNDDGSFNFPDAPAARADGAAPAADGGAGGGPGAEGGAAGEVPGLPGPGPAGELGRADAAGSAGEGAGGAAAGVAPPQFLFRGKGKGKTAVQPVDGGTQLVRPDTGLPAPLPQGQVPTRAGAPTEEVLSLYKQAQALSDAVGGTLRADRVQRGALGQYDTQQGVMRVRSVQDYETVAHEVGHHLEGKIGARATQFIAANAQDLGRMDAVVGQFSPQEGWAEAIRLMATNPKWMEVNEPALLGNIRLFMERTDPEALKAIDAGAKSFQAYNEAPSGDVVAANVVKRDHGEGILHRIREDGLLPTIRQGLQKTYDSLFDHLAPVNRTVRDLTRMMRDNAGGALVDLKHADNPEVLLRLAQRSHQGGASDLMDGVRAYADPTTRGPSMRGVLTVAAGKPSLVGRWDPAVTDAFSSYLVAKRAEYMWRKFEAGELSNRPVAFSKGDALQAMSDLEQQHPTFAPAADMFHEYTRALLTKQFDAGLIDNELYTKLMAEEFYAPLYRNRGDKPLESMSSGVGRTGGPQGPGAINTVKRFRGSDREIVDPIQGMMTQTMLVNRAIAHNDAVVALRDLARQAGSGAGALVEEIPAKQMMGTQFNVQDAMRNAARANGLDEADTQMLMSAVVNVFGDDPVFGSVFSSVPTKPNGEPVLFFKEGGAVKALRLASEKEGRGLYEAFVTQPQAVHDLWVRIMGTSANVLRTGITANPVFAATNFMRDQLAVAVLRPDFVPIWGGLKGAWQEVRQKDAALLYAASGGVSPGAAVGSIDHIVEGGVQDLGRKGYVVNRVTSLHGFLELAGVTEAGTRTNVFETVYRRELARGRTPDEAAVAGAYEATDLLDFSRHGSKTMIVKKLIPFLNASWQASDKAYRTMVEPLVQKATGDVATVQEQRAFNNALLAWAKFAGGGSALGFLWASLMSGHDAYDNVDPRLKATHIIYPMGNQVALWPKPFELGLGFNVGEEAYAKFVQGDARWDDRLWEAVSETIGEPFKPKRFIEGIPVVKTAAELMLGTSFFTGRPIVPADMAKLAPSEQWDDRTSEIAKTLGRITGTSPKKWDYSFGSLFGMYGKDIAAATTMASPDAPESPVDQMIFARRLIKSTAASSDITKRFWDHIGQTGGDLVQSKNTFDALTAQAKDGRAETFLKKQPDGVRAYVTLNSAADEDTGKGKFTGEDKLLHPLARASAAGQAILGLSKELRGNYQKSWEEGESLPMTPHERGQAIQALQTLSMIEQRNALIIAKEPGYERQRLIDPQTQFEVLRAVSPRTAAELATRYAGAKIVPTAAVAAAWPEAQKRLVQDGGEADIAELTSDAKADGWAFDGDRVKKPGKRKVAIPGTVPVPNPLQ